MESGNGELEKLLNFKTLLDRCHKAKQRMLIEYEEIKILQSFSLFFPINLNFLKSGKQGQTNFYYLAILMIYFAFMLPLITFSTHLIRGWSYKMQI